MPTDRRRRPNLFIVGAPKSGTTTLYHYLQDHPGVFMPWQKEPHFFDRDEPFRKEHLPEYLELFSDATSEHVYVGEGSTGYLSSLKASRAIRAFCPAARIIAMVRNPVDLAYSLHGELSYRLYEDEPDFEKAWSLQEPRRRGERIPGINLVGIDPRMLQYGTVARTGEQLARLLEVFPRDQVHVVVFDDFSKEPAASHADVLRFLGLPVLRRPSYPNFRPARRVRSRWLALQVRRPPRLVSLAAATLKRRLGIERVELLRPVRRLTERLNAPRVQRPPLSPDFRAELGRYFRADVERLGEILQRDLGHWT